ncbi:ORF62 [Agrotis segetum granulovirus]|uniref:ORF62 n=1 Tax=Agrotis segetum granulosis virus TaxID=10464 RepID=Q6QXP5_GVAS|nr:p24 [Agrotis segetum granulovirus]AAS82676.1 ORF62 [Agrotis segetum granulovirus]AHN92113.1 p24 [Agrotis segetum granulovirus]AKN63348.1 p24 [Agrotis segetum granulovirus]
MAFEYNSGPIEVFIVTNDEGLVNGYAEVNAVTQLLSPYTRLSHTQLWNATHPAYRIQNNNKNFIHAIVISKYLAAIPETEAQSYKNLRQLVRDLLVGDQNEENNEQIEGIKKNLEEIKDKLEEKNNYLSDFSGLLNVLKSEIVSEIRDLLKLSNEPVKTKEKEDDALVELCVIKEEK